MQSEWATQTEQTLKVGLDLTEWKVKVSWRVKITIRPTVGHYRSNIQGTHGVHSAERADESVSDMPRHLSSVSHSSVPHQYHE